MISTCSLWLVIGNSVVSLPCRACLVLEGQCWDWFAWCHYAVTRQENKFDLHLLSVCDLAYNGQSRSVCELHFACCCDIDAAVKETNPVTCR